MSAAREYERLRRDWLRKHRTFFWIAGGTAATVAVGSLLLAWPHTAAWVSGLFAGASLTFVLAARLSPPPWIENWQMGAFGEQRTAKAVEPLLAEGWSIIHDMNLVKSNLDHVLVGPGGVFVLDTKNGWGTASASSDTLTVVHPDGRKAFESDTYARRARAQGKALNALLNQRCGLHPWVSAVVVIWSDFEQQAVPGNRMTYVHGQYLADWLRSQPAKLNQSQISELVGALRPGQRRRERDVSRASGG